MLAAMSPARPTNVSVVTPDECGVIRTLVSSPNGSVAGGVVSPDPAGYRYQNVALASAERVAVGLSHVHESWIQRLEKQGVAVRAERTQLVGADHAFGRVRQRRGHHHDVGLAHQIGEAGHVSRPGQPVRVSVHPARSGDRRPCGAEGAEQLPGELADVAESDEADSGIPQRAGLWDRSSYTDVAHTSRRSDRSWRGSRGAT
jgi:hypothetical protein